MRYSRQPVIRSSQSAVMGNAGMDNSCAMEWPKN
ncbi:Hypothetical protein TRBEH2_214 [Escherichia phage vB_Eco_EH2]